MGLILEARKARLSRHQGRGQALQTRRPREVCELSALLGSAELSRQVLAPLSPSLITQLVRLRPERFTMQTILRMFDKNSNSGRKNMTRLLCLMRNVQADRKPIASQ